MALTAKYLINHGMGSLLNYPEVCGMGIFVESIESLTVEK